MLKAFFIILCMGLLGVGLWFAWVQPGMIDITIDDYTLSLKPFYIYAGMTGIIMAVAGLLFVYKRLAFVVHKTFFATEFLAVQALEAHALGLPGKAEKLWSKSAFKRSTSLQYVAPYYLGFSLLGQKKHNEALVCFQKLFEQPSTKWLGLQGLVSLYVAQDALQLVVSLIQREGREVLTFPWFVQHYYEASKMTQDWEVQESALDAMVKIGAMGPQVQRKEKAALYYAKAKSTTNDEQKYTWFNKSLHYDGNYFPSQRGLVQWFFDKHQLAKAAKHIEELWTSSPHDEWIQEYRKTATLPTPLDEYRHYQRLVSFNPAHAKSLLLMAQLSIHAQLWGEARYHLDLLHQTAPCVEGYLLYAELENLEYNNQEAAMRWLKEAVKTKIACG